MSFVRNILKWIKENVFPLPYAICIGKFIARQDSEMRIPNNTGIKKSSLKSLKADLMMIYEREQKRAMSLDDKAKVIIGFMPLASAILIHAATEIFKADSNKASELILIMLAFYFATSAVVLGLKSINVKGYEFIYLDDFQAGDKFKYPSDIQYIRLLYQKIKYNEKVNLTKSNNIYLAMKSVRNGVIILFLYALLLTIFQLYPFFSCLVF